MHLPLVSDLAEVLLPPLCISCGRPLRPPGPDPLCCTCQGAAERRGTPDATERIAHLAVTAAFTYEFPLTRALSYLKRHWSNALARWLTERLLERLVEEGLAAYPQVLVPVPLHPSRRRERGYDQSERLARVLAQRLGVPCVPRALRRRRATPPQRGSDRLARIDSLRGAFAAGPHAGGVAGLRIGLVDDVVTTGSTLLAAADSLADAFPAGLLGLVVARTPLQKHERDEGGLDRPCLTCERQAAPT